MKPQFSERNLVRLIRLVERYTSTSIGKILEQNGYAPLTARHLQVFENLDPRGSNIVQMAQNAAISKQAMSKLVKDVAAAGFVDALTDQRDSRFVIVRLTPKGEKLRQDILDKVVGYYDNFVDNDTITEGDIEGMTDTLLKFVRQFELAADWASSFELQVLSCMKYWLSIIWVIFRCVYSIRLGNKKHRFESFKSVFFFEKK